MSPPARTLQCPTTGLCVDHPHTIDLSRVFGASASKAPLPPHSHIVTTSAGHANEWWDVEIVGVTTLDEWNAIVSAKDIQAVRSCQSAGKCTADIGTNLFLFFKVAHSDTGADTPNK